MINNNNTNTNDNKSPKILLNLIIFNGCVILPYRIKANGVYLIEIKQLKGFIQPPTPQIESNRKYHPPNPGRTPHKPTPKIFVFQMRIK